jgi:hypothetical protein
MLIIWRGFGWAVPIIVLAAFLIMQLSLNSLLGDGYYKSNEWPKIAAIFIASLIIGFLGYLLNYKRRVVTVHEESGKQQKSPSHALFFIPIEFWAIILPALFFWVQYDNAETDAKELTYIRSPAINDKYSTDLTKIFSGADSKYKYGVMRVASVLPDGVEVEISAIAYDKKKGTSKDISEGKVNDQGYYSGNKMKFTTNELLKLHAEKSIYSVIR